MSAEAQALATIEARFGRHPGARALHAKGSWARGSFEASAAARSLSRAPHLQGERVEVLARLSNGGGNPKVPDYAPDVRGLAVSFRLPGGESTDIVAQSVPRFFSSTPREFLDFIKANTGRAAALRLPLFLATHPKALRHLRANAAALRPIPSFANCSFYGVHAFRWLDAEGGSRFVRYTLSPQAGEERIGPASAKELGRDYLSEELEGRLAKAPVAFDLEVQIAEPGDQVDDPAQHWPEERRRVKAGTLKLTEPIADPEREGSLIVFDPMRLIDGVEASADPVLAFRPGAYSASVERRG